MPLVDRDGIVLYKTTVDTSPIIQYGNMMHNTDETKGLNSVNNSALPSSAWYFATTYTRDGIYKSANDNINKEFISYGDMNIKTESLGLSGLAGTAILTRLFWDIATSGSKIICTIYII